jgi:predicted peptidase
MALRVIRTTVLLVLLTLLTRALESQTPSPQTGFLDRRVTVAGRSYHYQVFVPFSYSPSQRWPIILFLHGAGERGEDGLLPTQVGLGAAVRKNPARFPAIIVFPQVPAESLWTGTPAQMAIAALDQTGREFQIDSDRVYLTGLSMGGYGVWYLAYHYPSRFAALVPVCGFIGPFLSTAFPAAARLFTPIVPADSGAPYDALARQLRRVPTWIVHGEIDQVVPVEQSRQAAAAFKAAGAPVQYFEVPGTNHDVWDAAYGSPTLITWLFAQRRSR